MKIAVVLYHSDGRNYVALFKAKEKNKHKSEWSFAELRSESSENGLFTNGFGANQMYYLPYTSVEPLTHRKESLIRVKELAKNNTQESVKPVLKWKLQHNISNTFAKLNRTLNTKIKKFSKLFDSEIYW